MKKIIIVYVLVLTVFLSSPLFGAGQNDVPEMSLSSSAFAEGEMIPEIYSGEGGDISPPLQWSGFPEGTQSFVIIAEDPDAGGNLPGGIYIHWVFYNIPAGVQSLNEAVEKIEQPLQGGLQGKNSSGKIGYMGPYPPSGVHRYYFRIYALDTVLDLPAGQTKDQILRAVKDHVLARGELMGRYSL